jgi:hypothetical protein
LKFKVPQRQLQRICHLSLAQNCRKMQFYLQTSLWPKKWHKCLERTNRVTKALFDLTNRIYLDASMSAKKLVTALKFWSTCFVLQTCPHLAPCATCNPTTTMLFQTTLFFVLAVSALADVPAVQRLAQGSPSRPSVRATHSLCRCGGF